MQNINSESAFENHVRQIIQQDIIENNPNLILFNNKKAVDLLICRNDNPSLFFIEIKYHKNNHGRLGFGQAGGAGFQPEILTRRPAFFETNLRWIISAEDNEHFYFLNNTEILNYMQGGIVGEKHNGIRTQLFTSHQGISREQLTLELKNWFSV